MNKSDTKVALVTGAYRGLGLQTARELARRGYRVILTARSLDKAKAAAAELKAEGLAADPQRLDVTSEADIAALLSMLVTLFPAVAGVAYLLSPSERRLSFLRPISLAGLFAGLAGLLLGFINVLRGIWMRDAVDWNVVAVGTAEAMVPLTLAFGSLTFAWLCVAIGMRRRAD